MIGNTLVADNGRSRYVGRDFDLYFLQDDMFPHTDAYGADAEGHKLVASTNCSFTSNATFETVVDKSTPKAGVKELQSVDWSFQSDNNVADLPTLTNLINAHKSGTKIYVRLMTPKDAKAFVEKTDNDGSMQVASPGQEGDPLVSGFCVITSCTLNAQDGSLATFSMTLEGSGNYEVGK